MRAYASATCKTPDGELLCRLAWKPDSSLSLPPASCTHQSLTEFWIFTSVLVNGIVTAASCMVQPQQGLALSGAVTCGAQLCDQADCQIHEKDFFGSCMAKPGGQICPCAFRLRSPPNSVMLVTRCMWRCRIVTCGKPEHQFKQLLAARWTSLPGHRSAPA